ncbi:aquaporin-like protein [Auricularia subglabra TFB-10046 SS5]|nr:aquaporin-like protein [Auricularia subglabra TFB-10046 SS5]
MKTMYLHLFAALNEFFGTVLFLLFAYGGIQAASYSTLTGVAAGATANPVPTVDQLLFAAMSMGFGLLVAVWLFYRVSGGQFNPAVSTALLLTGCIPPVRFACYVVAQIAGGITAAAIVNAVVPNPLAVNTTPAPGVSTGQAIVIEMLITGALCLAVLLLAVEKHATTPMAPIGVGLTLFAGHLWGVAFTGAAMNPARALGPAVIAPSAAVWHTHWVYWVGPLLGSVLAAAIYTLLKHGGYELLNPGQDATFSKGPGVLPLARFGVGSVGQQTNSTLRSMGDSQLEDAPRLAHHKENSDNQV